jgi:hypothetical protein
MATLACMPEGSGGVTTQNGLGQQVCVEPEYVERDNSTLPPWVKRVHEAHCVHEKCKK